MNDTNIMTSWDDHISPPGSSAFPKQYGSERIRHQWEPETHRLDLFKREWAAMLRAALNLGNARALKGCALRCSPLGQADSFHGIVP